MFIFALNINPASAEQCRIAAGGELGWIYESAIAEVLIIRYYIYTGTSHPIVHIYKQIQWSIGLSANLILSARSLPEQFNELLANFLLHDFNTTLFLPWKDDAQ